MKKASNGWAVRGNKQLPSPCSRSVVSVFVQGICIYVGKYAPVHITITLCHLRRVCEWFFAEAENFAFLAYYVYYVLLFKGNLDLKQNGRISPFWCVSTFYLTILPFAIEMHHIIEMFMPPLEHSLEL